MQPQHAPCCAPLALLVVSEVADVSDSRASVVGLAALRAPVLGLHIVFRRARLAEPLANRLPPAATSARTTREHSPAPSATPQSLLAVTYLAHPHQEGKTAQPSLRALLVVVAERERNQCLALANIGVRPTQARRTLAFSR